LSTDSYVHVTSFPLGDQLELSRVRGLAVADAHVRYRRSAGDEVLFALPADAFAGAEQPEASQSTEEWAAARLDEVRGRLDALGISFDWERTALSSAPDLSRWTQWLFVKLVESGLAYQRGKGWFLRLESFNEENNRRVDELEGWSDAARAAQRELLHRVDGFDFNAKALDGTTLSVFTGSPDSVADAEFVGLSPLHPDLDRWLENPEVRASVEQMRAGSASGKPLEEMPVVDIGMSVQVPSVAQPLPILVSPAIDARFGAAAILGIPSVDPVDKALAKSLPKLGGLAWKVESKPPKTTPAHRYLVEDMPLSSGRSQGVPVPVVHCETCGALPVPVEQLPVTSGGDGACDCPGCGGSAQRDGGSVHPRLTSALLGFGLVVPPSERSDDLFGNAESARRLPAALSVVDIDSAPGLLDVRTIAKALRDVAGVDLADGEPLGPTTAYARLEIEGISLDEAIERHGADAIRFAVLNAAAPGKPFVGKSTVLDQAAAFLARVRELAIPRLEGAGTDGRIDGDDGLRRRLAGWCDTAVERVGENLDRVETHRATRNLVELLNRIEDFERRVVEYRGEVAGRDTEALAAALLTFTRLLAPIAPTLAAELWESAGGAGTVHEAAWPERRQAAAAA
jgi:leucyl-tRNA synthetase